ncbi:MAG TPA: hypothetical protein QGI39_06055 [Gammaproteobacteria bacterium]|jgi:hypothetical protein|nr:hypothetical protein [Gammaproteobacteria bacterium]|tara:strand:+ start:508 stop:768 length:261 start_codon:yes stop_codon:yes gene_type:complete
MSFVTVPEPEQEQDRDLIRSRQKLVDQQTELRSHILAEYGQQIEAMANTPRYKSSVQALTCYKGIKNLFALTRLNPAPCSTGWILL